MPTGKAKKPAQPGKKEEKGEAKKPLQEKKPENAPAKAKKEGAPKQASAPAKKKDPATKPAAGAAGAEGGKGKDKGKKRKLAETTPAKAKQGAASTDSKKKKVEKKSQSKGSAAGKSVVKKPTAKRLTRRPKPKKIISHTRTIPRGKQEIVVYEGRRYFLLPNGKLRAMLDIKLEDNDKMVKVDGTFIKRSDVKALEEFKESIKSDTPSANKRKLKLKLSILRRALMKDLLKEAKLTNKPQLATAKDAGREIQVMTMFKGTWVRKKIVPSLERFIRTRTIRIKAQRKEGKGPKELTEVEQKTLQRYVRKYLQEENHKLRQALLSTRPSVAGKQKAIKAAKIKKKGILAKKAALAKGKAASSKKPGADSKKQKRPAKKEKAAN